MNVTSRSARLGGKFWEPQKNLRFFKSRATGCGPVATSPSTRLDDVPEISKPSDPNHRTRNAETSKSSDRNYTTSVSTTTRETIIHQAPEARGIPILGTTLALLACGGASKLHEYVDKRHAELGPVFKDGIGPVKAIFVNSPYEYRRIFRLEGPTPQHFLPEPWVLYNKIRQCRRGLLFMDGEEWLHFRRILNKIMLIPDPAILMSGPCQEAAEDLVKRWDRQMEKDNVIQELQIQLYQWSIEAVLATLMGSSWNTRKHKFTRDTAKLAKMIHKIFEYSSQMSVISGKWAMKLRLPVWSKFVNCFDTAMEIVRNIVPEMTGIGGDGLLQKMIDEGIHGDDAVKIVADFILAAGDTTASSIQWTLLLLSRRPTCQENLFGAVKDLSPKEVMRDPLMKGTIKEALRLHPIAPFITRYLPEDSMIGGYFVPKGQLLLLSMYSSGRDSGNFPQPNEFLPERWCRTEGGAYRAVSQPHGSLPFALGARSCIGRKLAETQMSLVLAEIVKAFKIDCKNKDRIKMILHLTAVPSESIQLRLTRRHAN